MNRFLVIEVSFLSKKNSISHEATLSGVNKRWLKKSVLAELMASDRVSERRKEMLNDPMYKKSWIPTAEAVYVAKLKI